MKKIAIVLTFNDIEFFHGGSRKGLKEQISYFDQFLILYESIKKNWININFEYKIYVLHSLPFSDEKIEILKGLEVITLKVHYPRHETKIRPMAYSIDIECDYRLILDVDMYAIKDPKFDFSADVQAMYGGNKYNKAQWIKICDFIGCELPKGIILKFKPGSYNRYVFTEHYYYTSGRIFFKMFPYFNNGAILVRNSLSKKMGQLWEDYREKFSEFVKKEFQLNTDFEGQDVVGLAVASVTKKWKPFQKGFNFILQDAFSNGRKQMNRYSNRAVLLHYINIPKESVFYQMIENSYFEIRKKYYRDSR